MPLQMDGTKLSVKSLIQEFILKLKQCSLNTIQKYFPIKNKKKLVECDSFS